MTQFHDRAVIVSTGDEVTVGQLLDTNGQWIAQRLMEVGILPVEHATVPDDLGALVATLRRACDTAPLVVMSGGLGPTEGDLTRQAVAELTRDRLVLDEGARATIAAMLARRGRAMTERQERQAMRPERAEILANAVGTAPGLHARAKSAGAWGVSDVLCLPGPPGELRPMWASGVVARLRLEPDRAIVTRLCHIVGVPEAECVQRLGDLTKRDARPLVGITASGGILTLRIRADERGPDAAARAAGLVDGAEARARGVLGDHLFASGSGPGWENLVRRVIGLLVERGQTLGVVESCTGGMLGEMLTFAGGASAAFVGGAITYADGLKRELGVAAATIAAHGAVSRPVALEMASAGLARTGADHCLAITGVAGPGGGSEHKPVGTVHIALESRVGAGGGGGEARKFLFTGDREDIRRRAAVSALAMLYFRLRGSDAGTMLWEVPA
jgi:nicotinamide-nucleotide amidase